MKIISKHKDYYDYLQGIYGIDELKVLDRRSNNPHFRSLHLPSVGKNKVYHYTFAICDELYDIYERNGKFYHTYEEYVKLCKLHNDPIPICYKNNQYIYRDKHNKGVAKLRVWDDIYITEKVWDKLQGRETKINSKLRNPILVDVKESDYRRYSRRGDYKWEDNIILDNFKFIKKLDALSIYTKLDMFMGWLNDNPEKTSNITNDEKIKTKGFDIKKSFRHRK